MRALHDKGAARGFTLLELLVVLLLMTLIVGVVPPMLSGGMASAEVKGAARQLAAALRYARSEAIVQQRESALVLNVERRRYKISGLRREYQLADKLQISVVTAQQLADGTRGAIRFYPDGSSTGGRISVGDGKRNYLIDVDWLTGGVVILD